MPTLERLKASRTPKQRRPKIFKLFSRVTSDCEPDNAIAINIVSFGKLKQSAESFIIELSMTINFLEVLQRRLLRFVRDQFVIIKRAKGWENNDAAEIVIEIY